MRLHRIAFALAAALLSAVAAFATIGIPEQMLTGNPSNATADANNQTRYLIQRAQYAMDYNATTREPNWVAWNLTSGDVGGSGRSPDFFVDTTLPVGFYRVLTTDYSGSGYDRGHMTPSGDRTITRADNDVTFFMSNMVPQTPDNNQGVWASFETYCRTLAAAGNEILIISGPGGFAGSTIASGVAIPGYTWKIAVVVPLGAGTAVDRIDANTRVIAIKVPNISGVRSTPWQNYVTSATQLQTDTGLVFFSALNSTVAAALRAKVDGQTATGTPTITTQPVAQTAAVGGTATFTVAATSTTSTAFTYQWLKNDEPLTGNASATTATLTLTNVQAADVASYTVVVTNNVGPVTSAGAALVITGLPPVVVTSPVSLTRAAGTTAIFSVTASGSPTLSYQWRKAGTNLTDGANISGSTTSSLTVANVQTADAVAYDVIVTNSVASSAPSAAATLTVTPAAPTITTQPLPRTSNAAGTVTFSVVTSGTAPFTYQWRKGGVNLTDAGVVSGSNTATLTLTNVAIGDAANYDVVITNGIAPNATSTAVSLTVTTAPVGSQIAYTGGSLTQNFDGLPNTGTFTLSGNGPHLLRSSPINATGLDGWSLAKLSGSGANALFAVGTGSSNSGAVNSFGSTGSTDRALGALLSGAQAPVWGVVLSNNTGSTITQFTVSYTGEQWRYGGTTGADKISFEYQVGGSDIATGTFTAATSLDFTAPIGSGTTGALDGNATANRTAVASATITGLTWASGQTLVLRWKDFDVATSDSGLAIDDFTFTTPVAAPAVTPAIVSTTPTTGATGVNGTSPITVTFNQAVTVASGWFTLSSTVNGALAATVTGGPTTYTITPPVSFSDNDTVTVNFIASQITESGTGTLHPAANTTLTFTTAAPVAPSITTPPVATTVNAGTTATFTVVAGGTAPFSYQWRKGGANITGNTSATTATLSLPNVQAADAANYDVVISNGVAPAVTSTAVALTVTPVAPTVTAPVAVSILYGNNATFTVTATGTAPFTYQWRKAGTNLSNGTALNAATISGATSATLTLTSVTSADVGSYDVVVTNSVNPTTSAAATLTVTLPPEGPKTNYSGGTYTQTFDTLPNTGTFTFTGTGPFELSAASPNGVGASGLPGWSITKAGGSGANVLFKFDTGSSNSGGINSYGTSAASDRALGSLGSGTFAGRFGIALVNNTGTTLNTFTLGYTGEQWRNGGSNTPNKLTFSYATGATTLNVGPFTTVDALSFTAPIASSTSAVLDGNLAANRTVIAPLTITGLAWAPGQTLTLRWSDADDTGSDDGLSIDDLTFTAVPNITSRPLAQAILTGGNATFSVATTASPVTYQWRRNGVALSGATTATLTLTGATVASAGNYDCVLTNSAGSNTTSAVPLIVTAQFVSLSVTGTSATYDGTPKSVSVTSSPTNLPIVVTYDGKSTAPTDAGTYTVAASVTTPDAEGSTSAILTIAKATQTITLGSAPASIAPGTAFPLAATASSGLPVTLSVVSGNASVSGNSVTLTDSAPVTLRATQSGNNNYAAATADVTVTASAKLAQTITFAALADQRSTAAPVGLTATASSGLPVTFTLVSGPATLSGSTLTLTGAAGIVTVRAAQAGNATFNPAPDVDRSFAVTIASTAPVITAQPASQTALVGATATFSVTATGTPTPTYQWRKNGTPAGTGATLTLTNVTAADAAGYDVVVTNSVGSVTSSLARLTVNATPTAPVITRQPGNVVAVVGRSATFTVVATGAPAPTYQWSKGSAAIAGATSASLTLPSVATADAGTYTVTVTNSAGTATASATLRVIARSYAGTYFGSLGAGGTFALRIGDDNTGVFLAFLPGSSTAFVSRGVVINDNGTFSFTTGSNTTGTAAAGEFFAERSLAAANDTTFSGSISDTGAVSGSTSGASTLALAATKSPDTGTAAASAGFYQAGAAGSSAQTLAIVSPTGQALVVTQNGTAIDGGTGTVNATGQVTVTTAGRATISANVSADAALTATVTTAAGATTTFTGFSATSAALAQQRIVNLSTRTTAGTGDQVAIVGFVITGLESKPVLLRAVGPALRALGVTTALAAPRLDLRSSTGALLATNTAWGSAGNSAEIANAAARSGAFPLAAGSADSVILTTLAPGTYSAVISAADAIAGIGLVEVYDLSGGSLAQKLANLSTRAPIGSGEATLISGLVVGGSAPKRVLIRAAGPSLTQFGVAGALTRPTLTLFNATGAVLATNTAWTTSADSVALADAATQVGAFAFGVASADSALLVNLPPGAYTAQVTGAAGTTGITLLEVYELP